MEREIRILLDFEREDRISALDLSSFVFDFNRLYVILLRKMVDFPLLRDQGMPPFVRRRYWVPERYELQIPRIRFGSPGLIEFVPHAVGVAGLVWLLLQIIEKAQMWPLQKKKLKREIEKLEIEISDLRNRSSELLTAAETSAIRRVIRELESNPIKPSDLTIRLIKK